MMTIRALVLAMALAMLPDFVGAQETRASQWAQSDLAEAEAVVEAEASHAQLGAEELMERAAYGPRPIAARLIYIRALAQHASQAPVKTFLLQLVRDSLNDLLSAAAAFALLRGEASSSDALTDAVVRCLIDGTITGSDVRLDRAHSEFKQIFFVDCQGVVPDRATGKYLRRSRKSVIEDYFESTRDNRPVAVQIKQYVAQVSDPETSTVVRRVAVARLVELQETSLQAILEVWGQRVPTHVEVAKAILDVVRSAPNGSYCQPILDRWTANGEEWLRTMVRERAGIFLERRVVFPYRVLCIFLWRDDVYRSPDRACLRPGDWEWVGPGGDELGLRQW